MTIVIAGASGPNLQATLCASSSNGERYSPHHPITCTSQLRYWADGALSCEHTTAPADDVRTRSAINHSVAILLFECAYADGLGA